MAELSHTPPASALASTARDTFLDVYEREHATTMRVLRAYPTDQLDLRPHPKCKTARELAWVFVLERGLGAAVFQNQFAQLASQGEAPEPPEEWDDLLRALDEAHKEFGDLIRETPADDLDKRVEFLTGPNQVGEITRTEWLWFLLHDQIHHRGQFSIYLRMAGAAVPSIYGPTADEPWM